MKYCLSSIKSALDDGHR